MDIITCSRKDGDAKEMFATFSQSWKTSKLFEIVGYESIADGYNEGLRRAIMDSSDTVVAFTHSDVRNMASAYAIQRAMYFLFENVGVGFVGVAGSKQLSKQGVWWDDPKQNCGAITHEHKGNVYKSVFGRGFMETPVKVLDGVFLMAQKSTLKDFKFWSHDFHFYDIDACMQMNAKGLTNYVVDIPLLHYSIGALSESWELARQEFLTKWAPVSTVGVR